MVQKVEGGDQRILADGSLDQRSDLLGRLDVVVASVFAACRRCLFAIDTDAHAPGQLDWLDSGCERAQRAGIGPDRVLNARGAADLARGRRGKPL